MIGEVVIHAVFFVLMLFLFCTSFSFPVLNIGGKLGAGWWPRVVLTIGMVCTVVSVFLSVRKIKAKAVAGEKAKPVLTGREVRSLLISTVIIVVALLLINYIGLLGAMPILLLGFMIQLGDRHPVGIILFAILGSFAFALLFGRVMQVSLPRGLGFMRDLSYMIY
jgi:hypothetical protein